MSEYPDISHLEISDPGNVSKLDISHPYVSHLDISDLDVSYPDISHNESTQQEIPHPDILNMDIPIRDVLHLHFSDTYISVPERF